MHAKDCKLQYNSKIVLAASVICVHFAMLIRMVLLILLHHFNLLADDGLPIIQVGVAYSCSPRMELKREGRGWASSLLKMLTSPASFSSHLRSLIKVIFHIISA